MKLFKKSTDISEFIAFRKKDGVKIGFVPTMGALHAGHLSLIGFAREAGELVVCSIFVNPMQFNDKDDYEKYPTTLEQDINLLEESGCDIVFIPSVAEMYPNGTHPKKVYPLGYLETILEGKYRPGHFQGVCMVVDRLLSVIVPDHIYLGQKDLQQCLVIRKLTSLIGSSAETVICPTQREADGLAMSSRNLRLNQEVRKEAVRLYETLEFIRQEIHPGYLQDLKERARQYLASTGFRVDYLEIADTDTLEVQEEWDGKKRLVALVAAFLHKVRLIDNILI